MCRFRRPLQGTSRDLANELERIRRSHPRRSPSPPSQLESLQSSSCFPRRRSSLTVRCGECRGRRTWALCTRRGASMHAMPEGIDYGVIDDTAARGHGSFSRSTQRITTSTTQGVQRSLFDSRWPRLCFMQLSPQAIENQFERVAKAHRNTPAHVQPRRTRIMAAMMENNADAISQRVPPSQLSNGSCN